MDAAPAQAATPGFWIRRASLVDPKAARPAQKAEVHIGQRSHPALTMRIRAVIAALSKDPALPSATFEPEWDPCRALQYRTPNRDSSPLRHQVSGGCGRSDQIVSGMGERRSTNAGEDAMATSKRSIVRSFEL